MSSRDTERKHKGNLSTATCRQAPSWPDVILPSSSSHRTALEPQAAQTNHRKRWARIVSSRLMSSGTAPPWMCSFQIGLDSCPSSRSWAGWMHTEVSRQALRACTHSSADTTLSTNGALKEGRGKRATNSYAGFYKLSCRRIYTLLQINPQVPFFPTLVLQRGSSLNEE